MKLTREEREICDRYSERDQDGLVHCKECPLNLDARYCICKANCTREEFREYENANRKTKR